MSNVNPTAKDLVQMVRAAWAQFPGTIKEFAQALDMNLADVKRMIGKV